MNSSQRQFDQLAGMILAATIVLVFGVIPRLQEIHTTLLKVEHQNQLLLTRKN